MCLSTFCLAFTVSMTFPVGFPYHNNNRSGFTFFFDKYSHHCPGLPGALPRSRGSSQLSCTCRNRPPGSGLDVAFQSQNVFPVFVTPTRLIGRRNCSTIHYRTFFYFTFFISYMGGVDKWLYWTMSFSLRFFSYGRTIAAPYVCGFALPFPC